MTLNCSPIRGTLAHLKLQVVTVLGLAWDLILTLVGETWGTMSSAEKRFFLWRIVMSGISINLVYIWGSILFYYGRMPSWVNGAIGMGIIQPFRKTLSFNPIGWAVSLGSGVNETVMATPLVSVGSWDHYFATLVSICVAIAFLTEPRLWKRVRPYVSRFFATRYRQSKLDSYYRAYL